MRLSSLFLGAGIAAGVVLARPTPSSACGCFAPPDPTVPVVQAGEQIAFAVEDGIVTAHIKVQYAGPAAEFGWLLPLPAEPQLELGTDELFAQLIATTQPKYRLAREYEGACPFDPNNPGSFPASDSEGGSRDEDEVLVRQDSVGPYDYAILRGDTREPMLQWLRDNRFFIPAGTEDVVGPYIRPGSHFLALKLRKGQSTGDLQPVVLRYASDLPMIPIILTSVAANPDMGILVWMLGGARAIPRNYYHTLINDAAVDWLNAGQNYLDLVTRAVDEAPEHRSFVTEFAGDSTRMRDVLDYDGRFGDPAHLATLTDAVQFVEQVFADGYGVGSNQPPFFQPQLTSQAIAVLSRHLPVPAKLTTDGITPNDYYVNLRYWAEIAAMSPSEYPDLDLDLDPAVVAAELEERVVAPTLAAGRLFRDHPYMTRLFTTLSPDEMTRDPVFSFNPDLPEVPNVRTARLVFECDGPDGDIADVPATIITADGWTLRLPQGTRVNPWLLETNLPSSLRTEILREEGGPQAVRNNAGLIASVLGGGQEAGNGCAVGGRAPAWGFLVLLGVPLLLRRRRR
jgi:hypothetical protein